jgi:TrmH family RNA methyltransferase
VASRSLCLALDDVQDPGNLGTIIRIADWFGIEDIFCSRGTVDVYNPKVIQATMGAIARVRVHYVDLAEFIATAGDIPVYGTFLDGENMYGHELSANGIIVMGNEGNGIGSEVERLINKKLYIPNYPADRATSESLNVAVATAIVCAEFRRRNS